MYAISSRSRLLLNVACFFLLKREECSIFALLIVYIILYICFQILPTCSSLFLLKDDKLHTESAVCSIAVSVCTCSIVGFIKGEALIQCISNTLLE